MNRNFENRVPNSEKRLSDETLTRMMRGLSKRTPPPNLRSNLLVLASREQRPTLSTAGKGLEFRDRARLFVQNLMRPLALPFAGGVFSTVLLFSFGLGPVY